jgi:hypothetical protein
MRARAEALGGRLSAGAGLRGGFLVTAVLPLRAPDGTEPAAAPAPAGAPGGSVDDLAGPDGEPAGSAGGAPASAAPGDATGTEREAT